MSDEPNSPEELGSCQVGMSIVRMTRAECDEVAGTWTRESPTICVVATTALGPANSDDVAYLERLVGTIVERDQTAAELWKKYWPIYYQMAQPIVELMRRDEIVRRLVLTIVVAPALQALRLAGLYLDPDNDDSHVLGAVSDAVDRLERNLKLLGVSRGEQLARTVFEALSATK